MDVHLEKTTIPIERESLVGTLLAPAEALPGVLFVHGWGGSQEQDLARAREAAGLGCVCLTFDLRGHDERTAAQRGRVTRGQNLGDLAAAYDWLTSRPNVDPNAIAVVGVSYGGYLAAILSSLRPVRWLALRSPALYKDERWELPKLELHADPDLRAYRLRRVEPADNVALRACAAFRGDALIVEAEHDDIVPHPVIKNFVAALSQARSLTARVVAGADHAFSDKQSQRDYTSVLIQWLTEMIVGARASSAKAKVEQHNRQERAAAAPAAAGADQGSPAPR